MKRFKDVFEETGKQYGVLYSDYGISDCDLSREGLRRRNCTN